MKNPLSKLFCIKKQNAHIEITFLGIKLKFRNPFINPLEDCCCIPNLEYLLSQNPRIWHPVGIVIHKNAIIGKNCSIYQNVTIGSDGNPEHVPTIGDNVTIYANAVVFGKITVGNNAKIGAGAVVFHDVPENSVVAGNPAKIIKYGNSHGNSDTSEL